MNAFQYISTSISIIYKYFTTLPPPPSFSDFGFDNSFLIFQYLSLKTKVLNTPVIKWSRQSIDTFYMWFYSVKHEPTTTAVWRNITILYEREKKEDVVLFFAFFPFLRPFYHGGVFPKWEHTELYSLNNSTNTHLADFITRNSYHHKNIRVLFTSNNENTVFTQKIGVCEKMGGFHLPPPYLGYMGNSVVSNVKFYTVEYWHPSLTEPVLINLHKHKFAVGSSILGNVFIYRYLQHVFGNRVPFDLKYKLVVMNEQFEMFEMDSSQSIYLEENEYKLEG